jgi:hypothetical protein
MVEQSEDSETQSAFAGTAFAYKPQVFPGKDFNSDTPEDASPSWVFDREVRREERRRLASFCPVCSDC